MKLFPKINFFLYTKIPNPKGNYFDLEKGFPNSGYAKITYLD